MNDDVFTAKVLQWIPRVSCSEVEVTFDGLFSGAVLADLLSTFDISFFTEQWHDAIVTTDVESPRSRIANIESIKNRLEDYYLERLSRFLPYSRQFAFNVESIALNQDRTELAKLLVVVVFAVGTSEMFMEELRNVVSEDEMNVIVNKLAFLNKDVPVICVDDKDVVERIYSEGKREIVELTTKNRSLASNLAIAETAREELSEELLQVKEHNETMNRQLMQQVEDQQFSSRKQAQQSAEMSLQIERQIRELEEEVSALKSSKHDLQIDIQSKVDRIIRLQDENEETREALRECQDRLQTTQIKIQQMKEVKVDANQEELLRRRAEAYFKEVVRLRDQVNDMETLKLQVDHYKQAYNDNDEKMSILTKQNHELKAENSRLLRRINHLEGMIPVVPSKSTDDLENISSFTNSVSLHSELEAASLSFDYETRLQDLESENAKLRAQVDNFERQHSKIKSVQNETADSHKTKVEIMQSKIDNYRIMVEEHDFQFKTLQEKCDAYAAENQNRTVELERLKAELTSANLQIRAKDAALKDKEDILTEYVRIHINLNEAIGSTEINDHAKLKCDYVNLKVAHEKLKMDYATLQTGYDGLVQEQRLITKNWHDMALERHGEAVAQHNRSFPEDPLSRASSRLQTASSNASTTSDGGGGFIRQASRRFPFFSLRSFLFCLTVYVLICIVFRSPIFSSPYTSLMISGASNTFVPT